jgi:hypothetical protein
VEPINLVANWERSLKEYGANHIIYSAKSTIGFTVLWGGVGVGHPQNQPMSDDECSRGDIVELTTVVTLNSFDGAAKLCGDKGKKNLTRWKRCQI